jgi:hypothetical protein
LKSAISLSLGIVLLATVTGQPAAAQALGQARLWDPPGPCDRECLIELADDYVAAVVAHDPTAVPLADNIRFTENTELLRPGEGLWQTATAGPEEFRIYVADPVSRMIGYFNVMESGGEPVMLGLRLRIEDSGEITEAEHMVVSGLSPDGLANLQTPRPGLLPTDILPADERLPRELMLVIGQTYYDAIQLSDGDATLFADNCQRRENGMTSAGGVGRGGLMRPGCKAQLDSRYMSYIESIDLRRVWIADEPTGLVFGISQFRHPLVDTTLDMYDEDGNLTERDMSEYDPFDMPAMHIFKIRDARIHEIEATGIVMPYMAPSGWNPHLR